MRFVRVLGVFTVVWGVSSTAAAQSQDTYSQLFNTEGLILASDEQSTAQEPEERGSVDQPETTAALLQTATPPPQPEHTGFKALAFTTGADFKAFPRRKSTWVILGLGAAGAALSHPADDTVTAQLARSKIGGRWFAAGKYAGAVWAQAAAATALYTIGRYAMPHADGVRTNKVSHLGFDLLRAAIVSQAVTQGMKYAVGRDRPTGECCAFPSGHAASAFATAAVLERHLGYRGAWPTMVLASYVAASRLHDNRHFLSDVVFGASVGMATGWTVVGRHGRSNYALLPVPTRDGVLVTVSRVRSGAQDRSGESGGSGRSGRSN